jgi:hypothetical protein
MLHKALARKILAPAAMLITTCCFAQSPPANKPDGKTQPDALPGSFIVELPAAYSPLAKLNYVRTKEAMGKYTSETEFNNVSATTDGYWNIKEATQYLDGIGRPLQTIVRQAGAGVSPKDIIAAQVYDQYGREAYKFLPYVSGSTDGRLRLDAFNEQKSYMLSQYPGEQVYYGVTRFEASPLSRPEKTFAPGNNWAGSENSANEKAVKQLYLLNAADEVRVWTIGYSALTYSNDENTNVPVTLVFYPAGELYKNVMVDEAGNAVVEYKDKDGLVLLKKVQSGNIAADYSGYDGFLCTYYVYDDFNQLRFVVPPKAVELLVGSWQLATDAMNELCFRYEYDARKRMIAKKVPGAGWVYMVYDKRDRLVFTQDANMRGENQWMTTLYDALNRPVTTGITVYTGTAQALQAYVDANTGMGGVANQQVDVPGALDLYVSERVTSVAVYKARNSVTITGEFTSENAAEFEAYTEAGTPNTTTVEQVLDNPLPDPGAFIALTITHYDNYAGISKTYSTANNSYLNNINNPRKEQLPAQVSTLTKGAVTSAMVRVIEDPNDLDKGAWLNITTFYDDQGRVIQTRTCMISVEKY